MDRAAPPIIDPTVDFRKVVVNAIEECRAAGGAPSLVLAPIGYELGRALEVSPFAEVELSGPGIPPGQEQAFSGVISNVPVYSDRDVPADRLAIVDLKRAAEVVEWPGQDDAGLTVTVSAFDEAGADAWVAENPGVVTDDRDAAAAALTVRERAVIDVRLCWRVKAGDPAGVRLVSIPDDLVRKRP